MSEKEINESNCDHVCEGCSASNCPSRNGGIPKLKAHEATNIKHVIAVISGKGGVGKSMVTSLLAVALSKKGYKVGILDADVTGPSIPKIFGVKEKASGNDLGIFPCMSKKGEIEIMSANCLLDDEAAPVIWRGPMVSSFVGQLFTEVIYGDLDYLLIDMPPGTSDVPLTVFQQLPVEASIVVTSPQDLVSLIVEKSVNMMMQMNIRVLGIIENMSYLICPDCGKKISVFGEGKSDEAAAKYGLEIIDRLPINPKLTFLADSGDIENADVSELNNTIEKILAI